MLSGTGNWALVIAVFMLVYFGQRKVLEFWLEVPTVWFDMPTTIDGKDVFFGLCWTLIVGLSYVLFFLLGGWTLPVYVFLLTLFGKYMR